MIHWEDVDQVRFRVHTVVPHPQPQLTPRNLCLYLFETHVLMSLMSGPQPAALLAFRSPAKAALACGQRPSGCTLCGWVVVPQSGTLFERHAAHRPATIVFPIFFDLCI